MGAQLRVTSGPVLDKPGDLAGLLTNLNPGDVLFIDEIHRLSPIVEEYLYSAMEDFKIDIVLDKGPSARSIQIELAPFTLIGATTRSGLLTSPLEGALRHPVPSEYYDAAVLAGIVRRSARFSTSRSTTMRPGGRAAFTRHAAYRQCPAAPRARLRTGQGRRTYRPGESHASPLRR